MKDLSEVRQDWKQNKNKILVVANIKIKTHTRICEGFKKVKGHFTIDCKGNFENKYKESNITCQYCKMEEDDQPHMLQCNVIRKNLRSTEVMEEKYEYEDLFNDVRKQKLITVVFTKIIEIRNKLKDETEREALDLCTLLVLVDSSDT